MRPPGVNADSSLPDTTWSVVLAARPDHPARQAALENLCRRYYYPVYCFIRRRGNDPERSRDLTQAFFAHVLHRDVLAAADPARGSFRAFLLQVCRHFLIDEWKRDQR